MTLNSIYLSKINLNVHDMEDNIKISPQQVQNNYSQV
jgi:hypothetical protein